MQDGVSRLQGTSYSKCQGIRIGATLHSDHCKRLSSSSDSVSRNPVLLPVRAVCQLSREPSGFAPAANRLVVHPSFWAASATVRLSPCTDTLPRHVQGSVSPL